MARREFWGLDDSIGHLARIVFRRFTVAFEKRTSPHRISMGQYALLRCLWKSDGIAQHDIAHRMGLCEPTVAVTARRETLVYLTEEGQDLEPRLMCASQAAHKAATRNLSIHEIATLHALLRRVERNLATFEAALIDVES
jgi:DNA-binding MarR family transcriptional regulator